MDAVKFLRWFKFMCITYGGSPEVACKLCPAYGENNGMKMGCGVFINEHPEKFVKIVEEFAKKEEAKNDSR